MRAVVAVVLLIGSSRPAPAAQQSPSLMSAMACLATARSARLEIIGRGGGRPVSRLEVRRTAHAGQLHLILQPPFEPSGEVHRRLSSSMARFVMTSVIALATRPEGHFDDADAVRWIDLAWQCDDADEQVASSPDDGRASEILRLYAPPKRP